MKANRKIGLLGVFLATTITANAQQKQLSLQEAIDLSIKNSKQLHANAAQIKQAVATYKEAKDNRLPDLSISASYLRLTNPTVDLKVKLSNAPDTGSSTSIPKVDQAAYVMASADLPLFAGFKIKSGIESAKFLEKAAELDAETNKDAVAQNAIDAYSNLYKAVEALKLVEENLKQSHQRSVDFGNLEQNGVIARNDLLKAELQESNVQLTKLDAESNLKIATVNMDLMLGLPESTELVVDESAFATISSDDRGLNDWETTALQNRKDAEALSYREKAALANVKFAKADYYPSLALSGGYVAAYIPNFLTISNVINGGIGLSYKPSMLWKNGGKVAQAKARVAEIEANQGMIDDQIRLQINRSYENFMLSKRKIDVYNKAVEQANENYKITKNKYDNSLVTTTDLLDADVAQLQSQLNYAYSKADAVVAYNKLLQTAGVLTGNPTTAK